MLKKAFYVSMTALIFTSPVMAIEMPAAPEVTFSKEATAYPSNTFNRILEAHGLVFMPEYSGTVQESYVSMSGNGPVFNDLAHAYAPADYHRILTAYGLELTPENARSIAIQSYVRVVGDEIVFGDDAAIAYNSGEWRNILSAYTPVKVEEPVVVPPPVVEVDSDGDGVPDYRDECPNTPKGVPVNERGCWEYSGVLFELNNAEIQPAFREELRGAGRIFELNPDLKVVVEGHTCDLGSREYNQRLSERRAKAVVDYLVNEVGVDPAAVKSVGRGPDQPAYSNETEEGKAKNRRVLFQPWE